MARAPHPMPTRRAVVSAVLTAAAALTASSSGESGEPLGRPSAMVHGPGPIVPLSQLRFTRTVVAFSKCGKLSDLEQAEGFDPFESFLQTAQPCGSGYGHVATSQQSRIDPSSLTATGDSFTKSNGGGPGTITIVGDSHFQVTFELPVASSFVLDGAIRTTLIKGGLMLGAEITLRGAGGGTIFTHSVSGGAEEVIHEAGELEPGVYTLRAFSDLGLEGEVPSLAVGEASFDLAFEVTEIVRCAADLDGSGAVDFGDLLAILAAWGNPGGPEDLDGSGVVDFGDLLIVLADWGPCP